MVPHTPPPPPAFLDGDVRVLNVKQPWASALALGAKDIENRPNHLRLDHLPGWVVVVASKSKPTARAASALHDTLRATGQLHLAAMLGVDPHDPHDLLPKQAIVGLCKFRRSYTGAELEECELCSPWYDGGDQKAWLVEEAFHFATPIPYGKGQLGLVRLNNMETTRRAMLKDAILCALSTAVAQPAMGITVAATTATTVAASTATTDASDAHATAASVCCQRAPSRSAATAAGPTLPRRGSVAANAAEAPVLVGPTTAASKVASKKRKQPGAPKALTQHLHALYSTPTHELETWRARLRSDEPRQADLDATMAVGAPGITAIRLADGLVHIKGCLSVPLQQYLATEIMRRGLEAPPRGFWRDRATTATPVPTPTAATPTPTPTIHATVAATATLREGVDTVADETEDKRKKKRKLFKKGASSNGMLDGADGADGDEATQSCAVDHLVTPQKKVHKGTVPRGVLYTEIEDTKEEICKRKATIVGLENQLKEAVDTTTTTAAPLGAYSPREPNTSPNAGRGRVFTAINSYPDVFKSVCTKIVSLARAADNTMPAMQPSHVLSLHYSHPKGKRERACFAERRKT